MDKEREQMSDTSHNETRIKARRIVLLGASNLSRAFPKLVNRLQPTACQPTEWVVAKGFGRSYGKKSSFFGKKNCGIIQSGLWKHLQHNLDVPTDALVTDVGNDIVYNEPVEQVLDWVDEVLHRLLAVHANVVMTNLPIGPIQTLGQMRFRLFRTLLFPTCRLTLEEIVDRAQLLHAGLDRIAKTYKVSIYKPKSEWYGFDPIHVRRKVQQAAWDEILEGWIEKSERADVVKPTLVRPQDLRRLQPERVSLFGVQRRRQQPSGCFQDGTTFWLY